MWLLDLLKSPSEFKYDPKGYLRNQIGHAYVVGGGLALLGFPLWFIFLGYMTWELVQYEWYESKLWDGFEDTAHVMLIAAAAHFFLWQLVACHLLFLMSGYLWRLDNTKG